MGKGLWPGQPPDLTRRKQRYNCLRCGDRQQSQELNRKQASQMHEAIGLQGLGNPLSFFRFYLSFCPMLLVLYYYDFRQPTALTTRTVADICFHIVAIAYGVIAIFINKLVGIAEKQQFIILRIVETLKKQEPSQRPKSSKPVTKKPKNSN